MSKSRIKAKRKKKEETKRRFEAIKDLMSTFAMSTVAVVAVVTLVPASPEAEITKVVSLSDEIVYQVRVTDEDNALDLSTLNVVLENQLEYYEEPIELGEYSGYFDGLEHNTEYRLSVYGNKGFGQERLDTLLITTEEKVGGTILSVTPQKTDHETTYLVDIYVNDPDSSYTSINLYYGYTWEVDAELEYFSVPVVESRTTLELSGIFTSEDIHIYLEGSTSNGEEVLDEIWVTPPFELFTSLYMNSINKSQVGYYLYGDTNIEGISYRMNVYKNSLLITTKQIDSTTGDFHGTEFIIDNLLPETTYQFECVATFNNPQTLREEQVVIYDEEVTTITDYDITYKIETFDDFIEVSIFVIDNDHHFQIAFYDIYDTTGEDDFFLTGETFEFTNNGEEKSTIFTITIPTVETYRIKIGIRNRDDYKITKIIEVITNE